MMIQSDFQRKSNRNQFHVKWQLFLTKAIVCILKSIKTYLWIVFRHVKQKWIYYWKSSTALQILELWCSLRIKRFRGMRSKERPRNGNQKSRSSFILFPRPTETLVTRTNCDDFLTCCTWVCPVPRPSRRWCGWFLCRHNRKDSIWETDCTMTEWRKDKFTFVFIMRFKFGLLLGTETQG